MWIEQEHFLMVRVDFHDPKGELLKTMLMDDIRQIGGSDKWRGYTVEMRDIKTGHRTELKYDRMRLNTGLDDELFTERALTKYR
jgi:hypothetical protein